MLQLLVPQKKTSAPYSGSPTERLRTPTEVPRQWTGNVLHQSDNSVGVEMMYPYSLQMNSSKTNVIFTQEIVKEAAWGGTQFAQDDEGKVAAKFRKLMGIKQDSIETATSGKDQDITEVYI